MKATVLLVEDSKIQKLTNERILLKAGYSVLNAEDGEEAIRLAQEKIPDIVLLDMLLPKLGGAEVIRALKGNLATAGIPVLVLSSLPQANEQKLKTEGAAGYFEKSRLLANKGGEADFVIMIETLIRESKDEERAKAAFAGEQR